MISLDTNVLLPAVELRNRDHDKAAAFVDSMYSRDDVAISEFVLLELYVLLRNPAVLAKPLLPSAAVDVCESFRRHPTWQVVGFPVQSRDFHNTLWPQLRARGVARRRAYDLRLALALQNFGVTEFATVDTKDFKDTGFARVWNPLAT